MALWILIWLALATAVAAYANERGRSAIGWLFFSIFFSPILGFVIVAATPDLKAEAEDRARLGRLKDLPAMRRHLQNNRPGLDSTKGAGSARRRE